MATSLLKAVFLERRIPYRYTSIGKFKNEHLNFFFKGVLKTKPLKCNPDSKTDYVCLICHNHLNMCLLQIKSFLRFYTNVRVVLLSDGSLTGQDLLVLKKHLKGCKIFSRKELDSIVNREVKSDFLKELRKKDVSNLKLIDVNLVCQNKKIIVDSDVLFLRKPDEIILWIKNSDCGFYHTQKLKPRRNDIDISYPDKDNVNVQYYFRKNLNEINKKLNTNIKTLDFCSGFIGFDNKISLEKIEKVQKVLVSFIPKKVPSWGIEQIAYAFLIMENSKRLNDEFYFAKLNPQKLGPAKMIHFIGKLEHSEYLKEAKKVINHCR